MLELESAVQDREPAAFQDCVKQQTTQNGSDGGKQREEKYRARMGKAAGDYQVIVDLRQRQQRRIKRPDQNHRRSGDIDRHVNDKPTETPCEDLQPIEHKDVRVPTSAGIFPVPNPAAGTLTTDTPGIFQCYFAGVKSEGVSYVTPTVTPERGLNLVRPLIPAKSKRRPLACTCMPKRASPCDSVPRGPVPGRVFCRPFTSPSTLKVLSSRKIPANP